MIKALMKSSKSNLKAFTLAEVIFALFITVMVLSILYNLLFSIKKVNKDQRQHINQVAYAYVQLNKFMHAKDTKIVYPVTKDANSRRSAFTKINKNGEKETYVIEHYLNKNVLKVSKAGIGSGGGYMPLIFNIQVARFVTKKDQIIIHVTEKDNGKSDLFFKLDEKPESEEKLVKDKKSKRQCLI